MHAGKIVACVPAYNEENTIAKVLVRASRHVDKLVVVDDGSDDDTALIAEKLGALVIIHNQNLGKGIALRDCFDWVKKNDVDIVVTIDADGQHDPDEIPSLVAPIKAGEADIVVGGRPARPPGMTRKRTFGVKTLNTLVGIDEGGQLIDSQSGFRAYSKAAISTLEVSEWGFGLETEILLKAKKAGLRIRQVPVHMTYDREKRLRNAMVQFTDVVSTIVKVSLERRPLRIIGIPGFLLLLVGIYGWLDIVATYNAAQGFALGHALVYTTILLIGAFMAIAAVLLFVVELMIQRVSSRELH